MPILAAYKALLSSIILLSAVLGCWAGEQDGKEAAGYKLVLGIRNNAATLTQQADLDQRAQLRDRLQSAFDMRSIGEFVLGEFWSSASANERYDFIELLSDIVIQNVVDRIGGARDDAFTIERVTTARNGDVMVRSNLTLAANQNVVLDWRLRSSAQRLQVIDMIIDGRSLSVKRRDDYCDQIRANDNSVEALLIRLRERQPLVEHRSQ